MAGHARRVQTGAEIEAEENKELEAEGKAPHPEPEAFLSMPTSCESTPVTSANGESWSGERYGGPGETPITSRFFESPLAPEGHPFTGCGKLAFEPSINVHARQTRGGDAERLHRHGLRRPERHDLRQTGSPRQRTRATADAAVKSTELLLPQGVFASAGASQGLETCTSKGFGFEGFEPIGPLGPEAPLDQLLQNNQFSQAALDKTECPVGAKIGTVDIETPFLEEHVLGDVYLSREDTSPFTTPLVIYIFGETPDLSRAGEARRHRGTAAERPAEIRVRQHAAGAVQQADAAPARRPARAAGDTRKVR